MMSSQGNQRLRNSRNGSPSMKQGPIRATQQFGLASPSRGQVRQSPASSPAPKENRNRVRPLSETGLLSGRRSPSSPRIFEKPKPVVSGRSNSFDNVMAAPYLSGQWPKDGQWAQKDISVTPSQSIPSANLGAFTHDKQTQTPDDWEEGTERRRSKLSKARSQSVGGGDHQLKNIKHKLQRNGGHSSGVPGSSFQSRLSPSLPSGPCVPTIASPSSSMPIKIPMSTSSSTFTAPRGTPGKARGSVEGLNQEVEKLIISGRKQDASEAMVPLEDLDGHRAPVFELLSHTRSIDTQTPSHTTLTDCYPDQLPIMLEVAEIGMRSNSQGSEDNSACSSQGGESEERSQSVSPSFIPGQFELEDSATLEQNDDIEYTKLLSSSPTPNSEFMRQPPDGAEKIKIIDESSSRRLTKFTDVQHLVPSLKFQPSATSAFQSIPTKLGV